MRLQKILKYLVIGFIIILILLFLVVKIVEFDVWFHLSSGKYILDNFKLPHFDPFSYTAAHREYVDSHWLYQVFLYAFYHASGFFGLFVYQLLVIGLIFYILFRVGEKSNFFVTSTCIFFTLLVSNSRFLYRPEMFSYLFAVCFVFILKNRKKMYLLPLIQILWTNTHGFFIFGPTIVGCYLLGELIHEKRIAKPILLSVILCVLACFVNPYGYKLVLYPFLLLTEIGSKASPYMKSVSELTSTLSAEIGSYCKSSYYLLILISATSFFFSKKFNFSRFFVYIVFLYVSWTTVRNTVFFAFVGSLITIVNFTEVKKLSIPVSQNVLKISEYFYLISLPVLLIFVSYNVITNKYFRQERIIQQFGIGKISVLFPTGAIDFIKKNNLQGNIFNDALIGGYFIWNCYPERKCFVDGKMEIYGESFLTEYKSVIDNPDAYWQKIVDKYKIDYVLLHPMSPHSKNIIKHLYKNKEWKLVYFDESGVVFVKAISDVKPFIKEINIEDYSKPNKILTLISYANFFFFTQQYEKAQSHYVEALKLDPDLPEAYINLGSVFMLQKKYNDADACYRMAVRKSRNYAEPFYGIAVMYLERGNYEAAIENLGFALRIRSVFPEAQFLLSYIYIKSGNYDTAITYCQKILERNPSDEKVYNLIGTAYYQKGNYEMAFKSFEKALEIKPDFPEAKKNYRIAVDKMGGAVK